MCAPLAQGIGDVPAAFGRALEYGHRNCSVRPHGLLCSPNSIRLYNYIQVANSLLFMFFLEGLLVTVPGVMRLGVEHITHDFPFEVSDTHHYATYSWIACQLEVATSLGRYHN